jgi:hypothetical protein
MAVYTVSEGAADLAEGQYPAVIEKIETQAPQPGSRFDKPQLIITWKLTDVEREDGSDITRRQYVNDVATLTPKSGLYKLLSTVLNNGEPLAKDVDYDTDDLIGKPGVIFWGAYVGEDGSQKFKILQVSPAKKAGGSGAIRRKAQIASSEQIDPDQEIDDL